MATTIAVLHEDLGDATSDLDHDMAEPMPLLDETCEPFRHRGLAGAQGGGGAFPRKADVRLRRRPQVRHGRPVPRGRRRPWRPVFGDAPGSSAKDLLVAIGDLVGASARREIRLDRPGLVPAVRSAAVRSAPPGP